MKLGKMFFISLLKLFLSLGKANFKILDIQILWCHQMLKHKTRHPFYWITWEVNSFVNKIWLVYVILGTKFVSENPTKSSTWKPVPSPLVFAKK